MEGENLDQIKSSTPNQNEANYRTSYKPRGGRGGYKNVIKFNLISTE